MKNKKKKMYNTSFIIFFVVMFISICSFTLIRTNISKFNTSEKREYERNALTNNIQAYNGGVLTETTSGITINHNYWYYEESPVYRAPELTNDIYNDSDFEKDYKFGAVYWVIKLEGDIPVGTVTQNNKNINIDGFYLKYTPSGSSMKRDSVVGVYEASNGLDFKRYESYQDFVGANLDMKKLTGNPQNDKYFPTTKVENPEYSWYAENAGIDAIVFPQGYSLTDDKAIYIIIRTIPGANLSNSRLKQDFKNDISIGYDGKLTGEVISANYSHYSEGSLYNESKGAFTYDAVTQEFVSYSLHDYDGDDFDMKAHLDDIFSSPPSGLEFPSGTYAVWLLNVNWDGSLSGDVIVEDYLPEGIEFISADVYHIGRVAQNNPPITEEIDGLSGFEKIEVYNKRWNSNVISYYNSENRELRWKVNNLTQSSNGYVELNLRVICKVTDSDALLGNTYKQLTSTAKIGDSVKSSGTVFINRYGNMSKSIDTDLLTETYQETNQENIVSKKNVLPFKIEVNKFGENLTKTSSLPDLSVLPDLIDELSEKFELIEDSVKVIDSDGNLYNDYTLKLEKVGDKQKIIVGNLPNNKAFTLSYNVKTTEKPDVNVDVSNLAYWDGYTEPEIPQVTDVTFKYIPDIIDISIEKVFEDPNDNIVEMTSGNYYFGLFDNNDELLETLKIVYSEDDTKYYIDDKEVDSPIFSVYDLEIPYKVYELDDDKNIIENGGLAIINNNKYVVTYDGDNDSIKGNANLRIINKEKISTENDSKNDNQDNISHVPNTGDNLIIHIVLMILGLFGLLSTSIYIKLFNR